MFFRWEPHLQDTTFSLFSEVYGVDEKLYCSVNELYCHLWDPTWIPTSSHNLSTAGPYCIQSLCLPLSICILYIYIYIIHHFFWVWSIFNRIWSHVATPWLFALATKACFIPAFLWRPGAAETWVPRVPRGEEIHPGTAGDGHYNSAKISILPGCLGRGCLLENPRTQWRF